MDKNNNILSQGMTGFARLRQAIEIKPIHSQITNCDLANTTAKTTLANNKIICELEANSINSRFLEINLRCDDSLKFLEPSINSIARKIIKQYISRGRININLNVEIANDDVTPELDNTSIANHEQLWEKQSEKIQQQLSIINHIQNTISEKNPQANPLSIYEIFRLLGINFFEKALEKNNLKNILIGVIGEEGKIDENISDNQQDNLPQVFAPVFEKLVELLVASRKNEAKNIIPLLIEKCEDMQNKMAQIITISGKEKEQYENKIRQQMANIFEKYQIHKGSEGLDGKLNLDETRISQELAIILARLDITEEIERLSAHLDSLHKLLNSNNENLGKPLEFLLQELGREVNTIASKTSTNEITAITLEFKLTLEKIREQAMNLQ